MNLKSLALVACILIWLLACKKNPDNRVPVTPPGDDTAIAIVDSNTTFRSSSPNRVYPVQPYTFVDAGTKADTFVVVFFKNPHNRVDLRLLSYQQYYGIGLRNPDEALVVVYYQGSYYRNYKSPIPIGRAADFDTMIGGSIMTYSRLTFNNIPLQRADDQKTQILVSASLTFGMNGGITSYNMFSVNNVPVKLSSPYYGGPCSYSLDCAALDSSQLSIAFGKKPEPGDTYTISWQGICAYVPVMRLGYYDHKTQESYYLDEDTSAEPRRFAITASGNQYRLSFDSLKLIGMSGKTKLIRSVDIRFDPF